MESSGRNQWQRCAVRVSHHQEAVRSASAAGGSYLECRNKLCRPVRVRIEELNRDAVVSEGERDLLGSLRPEPVAAAPRDVDRLWIRMGCTPATRALDDPAPERDGADDSVDAERVPPAAPLKVKGCVIGLPRCVDTAAAAPSRRDMLGTSAPWEGNRTGPAQAAGDELFAGEPARVVDDASKPEAFALLHDEPAPPADDRFEVIGCCAHEACTRSGSIGSWAGEGSAGSVGSAGTSRGTGSSSGSTVYVRSGSPISIVPDPDVAVAKCCGCLDAPQADIRPVG
jgi:hypothetical protein